MSAGGQAEPPTMTSFIEEMSVGFASRWASRSVQMVGTAPASVGRSAAIIAASGAACRNRSGISMRGAGQERRVRQAPGHRVEHRHDGEHLAGRAEPERLRRCRPASSAGRSSGGCRRRPSGCRWCRRCSTARRRRARRRSGQSKWSGLSRSRSAQRCSGTWPADACASAARVAVADDDDVAQRGQVRQHAGQQRDQRRVDDDHAVLGVVDDVDELLGEQPQVQRVQHRAHARHGEVGHQVLGVVPHERGDAFVAR